MTLPLQTPPTRAALRKLLATVLRADADLDAFCLDHFFQVKHRYFADGMSRNVKTNLLLEFAEPEEIFTQLDRQFHEEVARQWELLQEDPRTIQAARRLQELKVERERLEQARQTFLQHGMTSVLLTEIDSKLLRLRREQRQGPFLHEGELVANRYSIMQRLGQGGFAAVWLAYVRDRDPQIVAVKVLHGQFAKDQTYIDRFLRGARKMAALTHEHIVQVLDGPAWDNELGLPYFVMPYLAGGDLREAALHRKFSRDSLSRILMQIGQALEYAHCNGLVHRDVKPQNILLDEQERAYLTDFDLVLGQDNTFVSRTGQGAGSIVYAAPEQLQNSKLVDKRADVYSLAMTALFLLRAEELPATAMAQTEEFISDLSINAQCKKALCRALRWRPEDRTASAMEFCCELQDALAKSDAGTPLVKSNQRPVADSPTTAIERRSADVVMEVEAARSPMLSLEPAMERIDRAIALTHQQSSQEYRPVHSPSTGWRPKLWLAGSLAVALGAYVISSLGIHTRIPPVDGQEQVSRTDNTSTANRPPSPATEVEMSSSDKNVSGASEAVTHEAEHLSGNSPPTDNDSTLSAGSLPLANDPKLPGATKLRGPHFVRTPSHLGPAPPLVDNQPPAPSTPASSPPQSPNQLQLSQLSPDERMQDAETIKQSLPKARAGSQELWLPIGLAACRIRDMQAATEAYLAATPAACVSIAAQCYQSGYRWINGTFRCYSCPPAASPLEQHGQVR